MLLAVELSRRSLEIPIPLVAQDPAFHTRYKLPSGPDRSQISQTVAQYVCHSLVLHVHVSFHQVPILLFNDS